MTIALHNLFTMSLHAYYQSLQYSSLKLEKYIDRWRGRYWHEAGEILERRQIYK